MSEKELAGKVAIVTGAGRNIGRAIALHLAQAGASVVINVRSNKTEADNVLREIEAAGGKATAVLGDVSDEKTAFALAEAAINRFGRIDFLVNNAALRREKPITEMSYADWREVMGVILDGTFHCVHACLPAMRKNGGTIINIGGMSANCVVPGAIDTRRPVSSQAPAHHLTHGTISGERGKPEDVAAMVRFLCSPGGRYVTGQTIHVSGGGYLGS